MVVAGKDDRALIILVGDVMPDLMLPRGIGLDNDPIRIAQGQLDGLHIEAHRNAAGFNQGLLVWI